MKSPKEDILSEPGRGRRHRFHVKSQQLTPGLLLCDSSFLTSCSGISCGQRGEILHHVIHHAHFSFILSQRNAHCSSFQRNVGKNVFNHTNARIKTRELELLEPICVSPAGLTCLKEVAAAMPRALFNSLTSCQAFRASHRLINPGDPLTTERGP